ncbi:GOLPH3/VPS74 family protein [Streptomyces durocortorensis]|uniref:GPP34 family phosphoprotein n=1 Tax=Streptomyces durocortorensis TaxID=2811104 RepID=A0ABS2HUS8_9ACTN|nr:GPP34 family phosphoprotein [Streptomyces durocortorensis]MBM7053528.1 GPP34 family phosphoprotein [Streptomyces durocortorensis]
MTVSLGEEIMLLSLDDETGAAKGETAARWGVAAGMLLELVMAGRVTVRGGRVEVFDPTSTGDTLLDGRLDRLTRWVHETSSSRKVVAWLTRDHAKGSQDVVDSLVARGLVTEEKHRALGVFPVRRYPEADGTVERELRARLAAAVLEGAEPDARTSALVALVHATGMHPQAFPGLPKKQVDPRMAEIAEGHWAGVSVREAIRNLQAAITAVTVVTVLSVVP